MKKRAQAAVTYPYYNRNLFSDHYLRTGTPTLPEWSEAMDAAWDAALALYKAKRTRLPRLNEAQTEEEWVRPILTQVLGWCYAVQPDATLFGRRNRPDYLLFTSEEAKSAASGAESPRYPSAAAVADAKYWARPLDRNLSDSRDRLTHANPSFQIVTYLVATGVDWGILTNGKEWRLYSLRARSRVDSYFAVDLGRILEEGDSEAFRWFHLFFRAAAFRPRADAGAAFVQRVLDGSVQYGAELEKRLKARIYTEVFPHLARGFARWRTLQGLESRDKPVLDEVFEGTLRLLYRLLFVLHAEARRLLPVGDETGYGRHSLARMRHKVAESVGNGFKLSDVADGLWGELATLFRILDRGDPSLNIPYYNGGLFSSADPHNAFFQDHRVPDFFLYPALERLTLDEAGHAIDYSSLSVEQLGSIYEGLLEFHLRVADDGGVYLHHDNTERHASGSYYTPPFIVRYIVESTLGPALRERGDRFRGLMKQIELRQARLETVEARMAEAPEREDAAATRWKFERYTLQDELRALEKQALDAVLGLHVCDPAMGSGHFLVHATDWITERLIALLNEFPGNPVLREIGLTRERIVASLTRQGIAIGAEWLPDTHLLKRMVAKRCIYGVDLNPMAVELAKLSLWLESFTTGAPLSFLDHHLKAGNSLVGTTVPRFQDVAAASPDGQYDVFGGRFAGVLRAGHVMLDVANTPDATLEELEHSVTRYREFREMMKPYTLLLDLWTSRAFGNKPAAGLALDHGEEVLAIGRGEKSRLGSESNTAIKRAQELHKQQHVFHWDLEFPEVFIDLELARWKDDPGFDAVIGNPPYVRQENLSIKPYLATDYRQVHDGAADLYIYFYQQGLELLHGGGRLSYIVTNKWLRAGYGAAVRAYLAEHARVEQIVDFGHAPIFPEADVFPCIVLLRRRGAPDEGDSPAVAEARVCAVPREALGTVELAEYVGEHGVAVSASRFTGNAWSLEPPEVEGLVEKIRAAGVPLRRRLVSPPLYGLKTGLNEAYVVDAATRDRLVREDPGCAALLQPCLRGHDVERWTPAWDGVWMIVLESSENRMWPWTGAPERRAEELFRHEYPALHRHLKPFEARLRKRSDRGEHWWELRSCAYYRAFAQPKILYPDLTWQSDFCWDTSGLYCINTVYFIPQASRWILAVLNSPAVWYLAWRTAVHGKDEVLRMFAEFVETLPVPPQPACWEREGEPLLARLESATRQRQAAGSELLEWLREEFGVEKPGNKLEAFGSLDEREFVAEVRRRRPRRTKLTAQGLARLKDTYQQYAPRIHQLAHEVAELEASLAAMVHAAFGLTPAEIELLWRTAPPRMPSRSPRAGV